MNNPSHTIRSIILLTSDFFKTRGIGTPRLDAELLLGKVLGMSRIQLYMNIDQPLEGREVDEYRLLVKDRGRRVPVAYLLGNKEFNSISLEVGDGVLIPRPDTEILVEEALSRIPEDESVMCADIGTGTGAIAIALAMNRPLVGIIAVDISDKALEYADRNIKGNGLSDRIRLVKGDLLNSLEGVAEKHSLHVIISNPPYIPSGDIPGLEPEVSRFEPSLALDGGRDGLDFYRRITRDSVEWLRPEGVLAYEVGAGQAQDVADIIRDTFRIRDVGIVKDLAGVERVVTGVFPGGGR